MNAQENTKPNVQLHLSEANNLWNIQALEISKNERAERERQRAMMEEIRQQRAPFSSRFKRLFGLK